MRYPSRVNLVSNEDTTDIVVRWYPLLGKNHSCQEAPDMRVAQAVETSTATGRVDTSDEASRERAA